MRGNLSSSAPHALPPSHVYQPRFLRNLASRFKSSICLRVWRDQKDIYPISMATTSLFKQQWYFRYDPIDKSHDSFRAVKLLPAPYSAPVECILSHERISALEGRYCALSYTWGERASQRWIRLNGKPFLIQPNLFEALKAIRKEDEEIFLWADGVCINQADTAERNHEVGLMGNIYRSAKNIRIWLGPAGEESDVVLDYVERDSDRFRREKRQGRLLRKSPNLKRRRSWTLSALYTVVHIGAEPGSSRRSYLRENLSFIAEQSPWMDFGSSCWHIGTVLWQTVSVTRSQIYRYIGSI